jgi:predicted enzyme related to lactoylglutathione lyase
MPRVVHFEISADDPERAIRFYEHVFGGEFTKGEGPMDYWLIQRPVCR